MATTFQVNENEQNDFQKIFADTLLSKLNIDSKFFNEIAERVVNLANKNLQSSPIKQTQQPLSKPQTKEKEAPKPTPVQNETKTQTSNKQTVNKTESLNTNKNVFQIVDPSKQKINLPEQDTSKQDSLFSKLTSVLENTTSKLEQTVKKVPRPWELTPGTAMGYQMLTGKESMGERARKGFAQFMGRYATNIKEPWMFDLEDVKQQPIKKLLKQVLTDKPDWLKNVPEDPKKASYDAARETLYRDLFDLKPRVQEDYLKKTGDKQYTLKDGTPNPDLANYFKEKEPWRVQDKTRVTSNPILGNVHLSQLPSGNFKYNDVWDLVTSGEETGSAPNGRNDPGSKFTYPFRKFISSFLKPPTVSGVVTEKGKPVSFDESLLESKNLFDKSAQQKQSTTVLPKNWTNEVSKEVSTKLEKMPVLSSLTKGIESIKGNKMVEGLKEISSVAPSVKPIVSFLTTNETSIKPKSTIELTDSKSFGNLKNWMKDTTVSKLNNWSTDLYDWSKEKISGFTSSMDSVLTGTEKLKPINSDSIKGSQTPFGNKFQETKNPLEGFDVDSLKSLVKGVQPDISSLQDKIGRENITLNNGALDQIVGNTKATNEAMKTLGSAIFKLAQTFNAGGRGPSGSNLYGATTGQTSDIMSRKRSDIMGGIASASQLAATNKDPIKEVRNQFWPQWGQLKPQWG